MYFIISEAFAPNLKKNISNYKSNLNNIKYSFINKAFTKASKEAYLADFLDITQFTKKLIKNHKNNYYPIYKNKKGG